MTAVWLPLTKRGTEHHCYCHCDTGQKRNRHKACYKCQHEVVTDCLLHGRVTHSLSFQRFQLSVFWLWTKMSRSSSRHRYPTISDAIFPFGFRSTQRGLRGGHVPALLSPCSLIVERIAPRVPIWTGTGQSGPSLPVLGWTLHCGAAAHCPWMKVVISFV